MQLCARLHQSFAWSQIDGLQSPVGMRNQLLPLQGFGDHPQDGKLQDASLPRPCWGCHDLRMHLPSIRR